MFFALVASQLILGIGPDSRSRSDRSASGAAQPLAGGQMFNDAGSAPSVSFSLVEGGLSAGSVDLGGNVDASPLIANPDGDDNIPGTVDDGIELQLQSPAIDAGSDALLPADVFDIDGDGDTTEPFPTDYNGRDRRYDDGGGAGTVDIGASESGTTSVAIESDGPTRGHELVLGQPFPNPISVSGTD